MPRVDADHSFEEAGHLWEAPLILGRRHRKAEHVAGLLRRLNAPVELFGKTRRPLHQLRIASCLFVPPKLDVVLESDPNVSTQQHRERGDQKLIRPDPRREPQGVFGHLADQVDHVLERPLTSGLITHDGLNPIRRLDHAVFDQFAHDPRPTAVVRLHLRIYARLLHFRSVAS